MSDEPDFDLIYREEALESLEPVACALAVSEMDPDLPLPPHPQDYARLSIAISLKRAVDLFADLVAGMRAERRAEEGRSDG